MNKVFFLFIFLFSVIAEGIQQNLYLESDQIASSISKVTGIEKCKIYQIQKKNEIVEVNAIIEIKENKNQNQKILNDLKNMYHAIVHIPLLLDINILSITETDNKIQIHALIKLLSNTTKNKIKYFVRKKPNYFASFLAGLVNLSLSETKETLIFRLLVQSILTRNMFKNYEDTSLIHSLGYAFLTGVSLKKNQ